MAKKLKDNFDLQYTYSGYIDNVKIDEKTDTSLMCLLDVNLQQVAG